MESAPPLANQPGPPSWPHSYPQTPDSQWPVQTRTNNYALTSMILGIVSVIFALAVTGIPAIIFGHKALRQLNQNQYESGSGMATAGIVLGWIGVAISIFIVMIFIFVIVVATAPFASFFWSDFPAVHVSYS